MERMILDEIKKLLKMDTKQLMELILRKVGIVGSYIYFRRDSNVDIAIIEIGGIGGEEIRVNLEQEIDWNYFAYDDRGYGYNYIIYDEYSPFRRSPDYFQLSNGSIKRSNLNPCHCGHRVGSHYIYIKRIGYYDFLKKDEEWTLENLHKTGHELSSKEDNQATPCPWNCLQCDCGGLIEIQSYQRIQVREMKKRGIILVQPNYIVAGGVLKYYPHAKHI